MPSERLAAHGFPNSDVEYISSMMRAFRRLSDPYAQVRFDVIDMGGAGLRGDRYLDAHIEASESALVAVAALPREVASQWPHALRVG
jgi:hypothetical protein